MRIKKLHIENYRGFESLTFEPPENLAVLIGTNGSGKSTILDAIAVVLRDFVDYYGLDPFDTHSNKGKEEPRLKNSDVSFTKNQCSVAIEVQPQDSENIYAWDTIKVLHGLPHYHKSSKDKALKDLFRDPQYVRTSQLPVLVHYQTPRISVNESSIHALGSSQEPPTHIPIYENSFSKKNNFFRDFLLWFEQEENYENEIRLRRDFDFKNPKLEIIRYVVRRFLNQSMGSHFQDLRIIRKRREATFTFDEQAEAASLVINKSDQILAIHQLSDGEQTLLMLVVDIARRLATASEEARNPSEILQGTGIILIDEIDLHLHPAWQRTVLSALQQTFPNCQLIVTTHSPQVLSNVPAENVFVLEDGKIWPADSPTFGRDTNAILSELMGVSERPIETKNKINACLKLIDEGNLEQAENAVGELEKMLGRFDTEVVRARTLIDFLSRQSEAQTV